MKKFIPVISILLLLCAHSPVQAQLTDQSILHDELQPSPTMKLWHICSDDVFIESASAVHAVLFWMEGCPHCHEVLNNVLPPLQEKYSDQLQITLIETSSMEDIERLYTAAARYGISKDQVGVPFLIVGEQVLIGSNQIPAEFPGLIETYLAQGGVALPDIPEFADHLPEQSKVERTQIPEQDEKADTTAPAEMQDNGFTLAIIILIAMAAALIYSLVSFAAGKTFALPGWADWFIPILIVLGIGVAGYLSYVETQVVAAICGPVGDCNTVQSSPYAYLFGVLPVGVLGLLGYLAMLAAWLARRFSPRMASTAAVSFWGMAVLAVVFSIYLTYLEPFVIKAVCVWCLASAVIVTLLLLLGTPPAVQGFAAADKDE